MRPWDINLRPQPWPCSRFQAGFFTEIGIKTFGANEHTTDVNVLKIWTPTQDALAMLKGFGPNSPETTLLNMINADAGEEVIDNGIRGHFNVTGDLEYEAGIGFWGRYFFPHNISFAVSLPIYSMRLKNVNFMDLTSEGMNAQDVSVRENLTDNFFDVVHSLDPELNLIGWSRTGIGDIALITEWYRDFPQAKPLVKNVSLTVRSGMTLPTGEKINENDIFSIPFGFDGSASLFIGGGIGVNWLYHLRWGIDFQFFHLFGNTRERRIKIADRQTEFLFLAQDKVFKDPGFVQRYNLFVEGFHIFHGLTASMVYQFYKRSDDSLAICSNAFNPNIANTANSLLEWTTHNALIKLTYDFQYDLDENTTYFKPQLGLFYKFSFNGERSVLVNSAGVLYFTLEF